jgi:hypothetical protein
MSNIITNILYAIGGAIFGGFVTYWSQIFWYKRTKFIDASVKFKDAFTECIHWLKYDAVSDSIRTPGKLKDFHNRHLDAINSFRSYLSINEQKRYNTVCEKFYNKKDNHYYAGYSGLDETPQKESREIVLNVIYELFAFAKY